MTTATALIAPVSQRCPVCRSLPRPISCSVDLLECTGCGHAWVHSQGEARNDVFESEEYIAWRTGDLWQSHRLMRIAGQRLDWVGDLLPRTGRSLEIGCSTGEVVQALAERGWSAYGIDPSVAAIRAGSARNTDAHLGVGFDPVEAGFPDGGYDLLCAFHVVEHIEDLDSFLSLARRQLAPGGLLYLRLPNWGSWSRSALGRFWPDLVPEHVHHFTSSSMTEWLRRGRLDPLVVTTTGDAREWAGGIRRMVSRHDRGTGCEPVGARSLRLLDVAQRLGRPWFRLEERLDRGSELVVVAQPTTR